MYQQCELQNGTAKTVAWIEERGAKPGRIVELLDIGLEPEMWTVVKVFPHKLTKEAVHEAGYHHKTHRKGSDI